MPKTGQDEYDRHKNKVAKSRQLGIMEKYPPGEAEQLTSRALYDANDKSAGLRTRARGIWGDKMDSPTGSMEDMRNKVDRPRRAAMAKALRGG
jgi:hypothetical protein